MTLRHAGVVRVTHWITTLCFFALLVSGVELVISHPRFYWGEAGNVNTPALFQLPIPASRATVPTGFGYVLPDQNGWSRSLHFQSAWAVLFAGAAYLLWGLIAGHFARKLWPSGGDKYYGLLQRSTYLTVIFVLFPLEVWTGLAMSPAVVAAFPTAMTVFGGQQSARTIHFFVSGFILLFVIGHVVMVSISGFQQRMKLMIVGGRA